MRQQRNNKKGYLMNVFTRISRSLGMTAGLLLCVSVAVAPAMAATITFNFSGTIDHVQNLLNPPFTTSTSPTAMTGSMTVNTFDSNASLTRGNYAVQNFNIQIGSYSAAFGGSGLVEIRNGNGNGLGADRFIATVTPLTGNPVNFLSPRLFDMDLRGPKTVFGSDALPTAMPSISSFSGNNQWRLVFGPQGFGKVVSGTLTAVPLPAAVILFGAGLVALAGLGAGSWKQRKNGLA